ncbi:hypothetical protein R1sor_002426 [Riccia sorocarpa]|uniref:Syndetin n=1 Tax=Riccia sorocarpa TaxID=122646 RepID=A0ABD3H1G7_9MARC
MEDFYKVGEKWLKTAVDTTSTIASTTTAIVATSSAKAFSIIGTGSGRPEVPARAAAAAAVARKIATLPPHERLSLPSTSDGGTSVYGRRPRGEPAEELEEGFYEDKFDPVRFMLEHLPEESNQMTRDYFDKQVGVRMVQLDLVTEKLSKQVMENHEEMVQGMQLVTELDRDLQLSNIICKNGRRFLSMAAQEVSHDLLVAANVRKKQVLLDLFPILERIQLAMETRSHLDSAVDEGDYAKALQLCSECLLLLEDCSSLQAVVEVNNSIEEWLHRTVDKVDKVLLGLCSKFEADKYAKVLLAYLVLDDIPGLAEKTQTYYAQVVVSETHSIIRNSVFEGHDPQVILQKSRVPYNDLCAQLTEPQFKDTLHKSLEVLFDLMCSYHQMMSWMPEMGPEDAKKTTDTESIALANGKHKRSGSHGDLLLTAGQSNRHSRTGSLSSSELSRFSPHSSQISSPRFSNLKHNKFEVASSNGASAPDEDFRGAMDDSEHGRVMRVRDAVFSVTRALEKGRKTVWELSARRVAVLLSSDALCATSPHQFLQSLDWVNKFILAGEAFCGAEAMSLRAKLVKQSEKYYWSFHRQNLEVLRIILEKELWQQLSPAALKTLDIHLGIVNVSAAVKASQAGSGREDGSGSSQQVQVENALLRTRENVSKRTSFDDWLEKGNPFSDRKLQKLPSKGGTDKASRLLENGSASGIVESTSQNGESRRGYGEDEEDENEDLLADFIDEDSQLPGRRVSEQRRKYTKDDGLLDDQGTLTLTSSAVSLLRYTDKYVKLMQILQPIVAEVFRGLCQLFELYFFTIFKVFGQRDHLTFSLRATLVRISQGLEEQRVKLPSPLSANVASSSGGTSPVGNPQASVEQTPSSMGQGGFVIPMSPSNLYALKERSVAAESLLCLSEILKKSYLRFKPILPEETQTYMDTFMTQTVELVPELREHIYRVSARLLLNIGSYIDRVANVKWELKELGMEHNGYVDLLLGEFKVYSNKLTQAGVPREVREAMLESGVDVLAETILEGISRVKKCNNEGRALMSLDLQVLINGLRHLASPKVKSNLLIVETYIKAFYLPETEYFHWVRAHPEYSKAQVVGLINLVASTYNWKRKSRMDLLEKIETGDN